MLTRELPSQAYPYLNLDDKVYQALQMMSDYQLQHLPLVEAEKYFGMVSEKELLEAPDDSIALRELQDYYPMPAVHENDHFLKAVAETVENHLSLIPVVDDNKAIVGLVTATDLLRQLYQFLNLQHHGALIVIELDQRSYSFSEISRIVETNDAQITQLNTEVNAEGKMTLTIRLNKTEVSDIVATFQRYEYVVKYYFGEELYENELKNNYDNLMNYLKF